MSRGGSHSSLKNKPHPDQKQTMKIAVAVITRNRPKSLHRLLTSYTQLVPPKHASLHFIIVENNDVLTVGDVVEKFSRALKKSENESAEISVDIEHTQGIPFV